MRFYFTNTANTRVFNVMLPGARMKLVGGDSGHYEHESLVEEVLLSPSERFVVDVLFERPGEHVLEHRTPARAPIGWRPSLWRTGQPSPRSRKEFAVPANQRGHDGRRTRTAPLLEYVTPALRLASGGGQLQGADRHRLLVSHAHPVIGKQETGEARQPGVKLLRTPAQPTSSVCTPPPGHHH